MNRAYEEIIDLLATGHAPAELAAFHPSAAASERVEFLIYREKTTGLSAEEAHELDLCVQLEHLMRLVKARARQHLAA